MAQRLPTPMQTAMPEEVDGPEPLRDLVNFTSNIIEKNRGNYIRSIDVHDICCKIAEIVIVGGSRRSALISLSNLTDNQMLTAKSGEFWKVNPQRQLANNSVAYTRKPDLASFIDEWKNLYLNKTGERGIFNRVAAINKAAENQRRDASQIVGINPCFSGFDRLLTIDGYKTFKELDGTEPYLINEDGDVTQGCVWKSGTKKTVTVKLSNQQTFTCTPDHIFKLSDDTKSMAKNLKGKYHETIYHLY